jgi:hypothetical protein
MDGHTLNGHILDIDLTQSGIRWPGLDPGRAASTAKAQDPAWELLSCLRPICSHQFLMRSFSNDGCFIREQLQRILMSYREPRLGL